MLRRIHNVTIRSQSGPLQTIINGGGSGIVIDSDHENRAGGITLKALPLPAELAVRLMSIILTIILLLGI